MNGSRIFWILTTLAMFVGAPTTLSAQGVSGGIRADVAMASFRNADYDTDPRFGLRAGLYADLAVGDQVGVRGEAVYVMKGVKSADGDATVAFDYVEVPVLVMVGLGTSPGPFVFTGPAVGFKLSAKLKTDSGSVDYEDLVRPIDFGWVAGIGFDASMGGTPVTFDVRYTMGLRSVFDFGDPDDSDADDKNQVFSAGVGVGLF